MHERVKWCWWGILEVVDLHLPLIIRLYISVVCTKYTISKLFSSPDPQNNVIVDKICTNIALSYTKLRYAYFID